MIVPDAAIIDYRRASEPVRADKTVRLLKAKVQLFAEQWSAPAAAYATTMLEALAFTRALSGRMRISLIGKQQSESRSAFWRRRAVWLGEKVA